MEAFQGLLDTFTTVGTTMFGIAGSAVDFIVAHPITLIPVGVWLLHRGVGLVKGLIQGV